MHELKGTKTDQAVLEYFYRQAKESAFSIYTLVLNKARVFEDLRQQQERLYNFVARALIEKCPFKEAQDRIILTLDKRKSAKEIEHFKWIFSHGEYSGSTNGEIRAGSIFLKAGLATKPSTWLENKATCEPCAPRSQNLANRTEGNILRSAQALLTGQQ